MDDWVFKVAAYNGTIDVDSYQEIDDGAMGQRDFMSDASGSTAWTYDTRGRVIAETQTISGTGAFVSGWSYNSANLPTSMTYPGGNTGQRGEVLDYSYNSQMALDRVFSQDYSYYYLQATQFDAAGRVLKRNMGANNLGSNPLLVSNFHFNDWDQEGGRLQFIHTGAYTNTTSLLNLVYAYDQVGNVDSVQDYTTGNPQTQSYEYDSLNRLLSASASGGYAGHGNYSESYTYDPDTGNLASKTGLGSYTYDQDHPHAVASTASGWSYSYRCNGKSRVNTKPGVDRRSNGFRQTAFICGSACPEAGDPVKGGATVSQRCRAKRSTLDGVAVGRTMAREERFECKGERVEPAAAKRVERLGYRKIM